MRLIIPKFLVDIWQAWLFVRKPETVGLPIVIGKKVYRIGEPTVKRCREVERLVELPDLERYSALVGKLQALETLLYESENLTVEAQSELRKKVDEIQTELDEWSKKQMSHIERVKAITRDKEKAVLLWDALLEGGLDKSVPRETMEGWIDELPDTLLSDMLSFFLAWRTQVSVNTRQKLEYMIRSMQRLTNGSSG